MLDSVNSLLLVTPSNGSLSHMRFDSMYLNKVSWSLAALALIAIFLFLFRYVSNKLLRLDFMEVAFLVLHGWMYLEWITICWVLYQIRPFQDCASEGTVAWLFNWKSSKIRVGWCYHCILNQCLAAFIMCDFKVLTTSDVDLLCSAGMQVLELFVYACTNDCRAWAGAVHVWTWAQ